MRIARPPDGFRIIERPAVTELIAAHCAKWPRLRDHWDGITQRLKFTGHREGVPVPKRPGYLLFVDDGEPSAELPRVRVVYLPLGDALMIEMVAVG